MNAQRIILAVLAAQFSVNARGEVLLAKEPQETLAVEDVVVVGARASLATARKIKQSHIEIVDSVIADDINKLPDYNVTDALQRITGVQILRDRGEGSGVAIRGLTQMETLFNGREVFTAGNGRNLDFADIPSEMVAAINVYKTSSAEHLEGGIGGTIDLRTRRPFDFSGREVVFSARDIYGDFIGRSKPQFSFLASDRWEIGGGEFGALVNVAYQERAWREDQKGTGNPRAITVDGATAYAPNGFSRTVTLGERERVGVSVVLQWLPTDKLDLYAEAHYSQFKTWQNGYQLFVTPTGAFDAASVSMFSGSRDVSGITWTTPSVANWGSGRDTVDRSSQFALGGSWNGDALTVKTDLSYSQSFNNLDYSVITLSGTADSATQNSVNSSRSLSNVNFTSAGMVRALRPFKGDLTAWQVDGEYRLGGFLETINGGLRYAWREADNKPGQVTYSGSGAIASIAGLIGASNYSDYTIGNPDDARDTANLHSALGLATSIPDSNPLGTWNISEDTQSAYVMTRFRGQYLPIDGNLGVRVVRTREQVSGYKTDATASGGVSPIDLDHEYVDTLPSMNLRYELRKGWYLRGAASKTMTRPDFNQMSPSLTLNATQLTGSAGNPELRPIRANNYDLAVEHYFGKSNSAYLTLFRKKVDGFIATLSNPETYDGITYQVSRPQNTNEGDIEGFEIGYTQFYDFLPGWLGGLGLQANYTYVGSETPSSLLGQNVPLQNLSKNSYNIIAMYEKGDISARVAYNWRSRFMSSIANISGVGAMPLYTEAYGWLDASLVYRYNPQISFALEGINLLNTERRAYYSTSNRPQNQWLNDRQLSATVTVRF